MANRSINTAQSNESRVTRGGRVIIALLSWGLAGISVFASLLLVRGAATSVGHSTGGLLQFIPPFAWLALAVMTVRWVQNRRCHWFWPVAGTAAGAVSAAFFIWVFVFYIAAVPLAAYLAIWHLRGRAPANDAA